MNFGNDDTATTVDSQRVLC